MAAITTFTSDHSAGIQAAKEWGRYFCSSGRNGHDTEDSHILNSGMSLYSLFQSKLINLLVAITHQNTTFCDHLSNYYAAPSLRRQAYFLPLFKHSNFSQWQGETHFGTDICLYTFQRILSQSFKDDGSITPEICTFLMCIKCYIHAVMDDEKTVGTEDIHTFLDASIRVFEHRDQSLLTTTPLELGLFPHADTPVYRYRSAMKNYVFLLNTLQHLCLFQKVDEALAVRTFSIGTKDDIQQFLGKQLQRIVTDLSRKTSYATATRVQLFLLVRRPLNRLVQTEEKLKKMQMNLFSLSTLKYYQAVLCTEKVQEIAATVITQRAEAILGPSLPNFYTGPNPVHPTYAEENRDVFENFVPRVREMVEYIASTSATAKRDLFVLREFAFFLQCGDVDKLIVQLKSAKGNQDVIDAIVYNEIEAFYQKRMQNPSCVASPAYIQSLPAFREIEQMWTTTPKAVTSLLRNKLERAHKWQTDLLPPKSKPHSHRVYPNNLKSREFDKDGALNLSQAQPTAKQPNLNSLRDAVGSQSQWLRRHEKGPVDLFRAKQVKCPCGTNWHRTPSKTDFSGCLGIHKHVEVPLQITGESSDAVPAAEVKESPHLEHASTITVPSPPANFNEMLENERRLLQTWLRQLSANCSPCTQEALSNAHEHFDNLLFSMRRIHNRAELSVPVVFSFINDTVRHCSLGVEQLLSALFRETNRIQSKQELAPYLTHDLFQILQDCRLDTGDFPHSIRTWIKEINYGEIMVRDFSLYSTRKNALQNLLWKNRRLTDESLKDTEVLFQALFDYLSPLGKLLETVQSKFSSFNCSTPVSVEESFSHFISTFCQEVSHIQKSQQQGDQIRQTEPNHVLPILSQLRNVLERASDPSAELNGSMDNILNNLLVHLETEASFYLQLEPIEASLHLSNVLLLNQIIAESVLIYKLHTTEIPLESGEEFQHDLLHLVEKLKIGHHFRLDELDFLKVGKLSRQFIRYPASQTHQIEHNQRSRKRSARKGSLSRADKIQNLLKASRQLTNKQVANLELQGFTSANLNDAKKLEEIKAFVAQDIRLLASIIQKIL